MTLFTLLLVLAWERLFKLGEHWQLDHRFDASATGDILWRTDTDFMGDFVSAVHWRGD